MKTEQSKKVITKLTGNPLVKATSDVAKGLGRRVGKVLQGEVLGSRGRNNTFVVNQERVFRLKFLLIYA